MKYCYKCKTNVPKSKFGKRSRSKDELSDICKPCKSKVNKEYAQKNKEKIRAYKKQYREANKEFLKESKHKEYEANKESYIQRANDYKEANRDKVAEYQKEYYNENKDKCNVHSRKSTIKRRALKQELNEDFTYEDECITLKRFDYKCFKCGTSDNIAIDHNKPLSKGFKLELSNAVVLCKSCNSKKHTKMPTEFYTQEELEILEKILKE